MRLTEHERRTIREAVAEVYGPTAVVRLFGSRVHDHLRGGDIDLHIEADDTGAGGELSLAGRLRSRLEQPLDDPRIDVVVTRRGRSPSPIERVAYSTGEPIEMPPDGEEKLVRDALDATRACLAALRRDLAKVQPMMPVTARVLAEADEAALDRVAAFLKRFENLVEVSRRQLFRAAIVVAGEEHDHDSARQVRDRLGRLGLLAEPDDWSRVEDARNKTAHVYPVGDERAAAALNETFAMARRAVELIAPMPDAVEARLARWLGR